jgi:short-subunit dehydrogenase
VTVDSPVLILGATSDIGQAVAVAYAQLGRAIILAGRNPARLQDVANAVRTATGRTSRTAIFDVCDISGHIRFLDDLGVTPTTVVCVVGYAGDQIALQQDPVGTEMVVRTNFSGPAALLGEVAQRMEQRSHGCIIAISSVTGERGRAKNYIYGAAKAGFTAFLSGLRQRLSRHGVHVVTVKAGFCNTRKSGGRFPPLLTSQPAQVAAAIVAAERQQRDVIYVLPIWRAIMTVVRLIPEGTFKRLRF